MTRAPVLAALLLLLGALAGCIELPDESAQDSFASASASDPPAASDAPAPSDRVDGMTLERNDAEDTVALCDGGGITVPPATYCATRTLSAGGRIGVDALPLQLLTVNGDVTLERSVDDVWTFDAVVKTRGMTEDEARRALDETWTWSHTDGTRHHLHAAPNLSLPLLTGQLHSASYRVALPSWVLLDGLVESTNGDLDVLDLQWDALSLETTNGDLTLRGQGASADATTTNGDIELDVRTSASGDFQLETTNGEIEVVLVESRDRGYDIEGRTSNGRVTIDLQDGDLGTDEKTHKTYRTRDYDHRAIQTKLTLRTTNGDIDVTP